MGKVSELSALTDELRKCGEALVGIADGLTELFSSSEEPEEKPAKKAAARKEPKAEVPEEKPLTLEDVRAVLAEKSRQGFTSDVKALLRKHGADKLSEINPAEYKALLADAEVIGNA